MAIPDYQTCMLPLLKFSSDRKEHSLREAIDNLAGHFNLTDEELKELLPSGQQSIFVNRIGWARSYMKQAGLLESTRRGFFQITQRGIDVLAQNPPKINVKYLEQFKEFLDFKKRKRVKPAQDNDVKNDQETTPAEADPTRKGADVRRVPMVSGQVFCCEIICGIFEERKANDGDHKIS